MSKRLFLGVLLAVVAVSAAATVWLLRSEGQSTRAEGGAVEMGIDPEVTGNTATTLGTLEYCVRVDVESPAFDNVSDYNIDVYVLGDTLAPVGYDAWVTYDPSKVHIAAPGTNTLIKLPGASSLGNAVPDTDGKFVAGVAYLSGGPGTAGDGALVRLGLDIGASGLVTFDFDAPEGATGYYSPGGDQPVVHPVTRMPALLAVNEECPPGGRPAPSPTPERAEATPTPDAKFALQRLRQEEASKPKFEGSINGIRIYSPDASAEEWRKDACTDAKPEEVEHPDITALAGTPMDIVPTYLPPGAEETDPRSTPTVCKGTIAYTERRWILHGKGELYVIRREGERAIHLDVPADRISAATVAGKPAALVAPIVEGYDYAVVVVADDIGITVVAALGLSLGDTVKVAEGLK